MANHGDAIALGTRAELLIRPEAVTLRPGAAGSARSGTVLERYFLGASIEYVVGIGTLRLTALTGPDVAITVGDRAELVIDETHAWLLPP